MNRDDFEREPRSRNTHLYKLNSNLNHNKKNQTYNISICSLTTFVPFHEAQNHSHKAKIPNSQYLHSLSQRYCKTVHQLQFIIENFINKRTQKKNPFNIFYHFPFHVPNFVPGIIYTLRKNPFGKFLMDFVFPSVS